VTYRADIVTFAFMPSRVETVTFFSINLLEAFTWPS
jgi:hypothetical protein